jgi:hypothetical protein
VLKKRTVFVLGAGANVPYGFSTGGKLLDLARASDPRQLMGNAGESITRGDSQKFKEALEDCMLPSIDALLEHRKDLWSVGKRVIATLLYQEEAKARPGPNEEDWMALIFERLARNAATLEDFCSNPVSFVTFNYDRYLEHRFIRALAVQYQVAPEEAWRRLLAFGFIHLHGSLGLLPAQVTGSDLPIPLGAPETDVLYTLGLALPQAENAIRIVADGDRIPQAFEEAQTRFQRAEQVAFLGFAFGEKNVERLGTARIPSNVAVACSAYGMTNAEINDAIGPAFPGRDIRNQIAPLSVRQFLREKLWLLK